MEKVNWVVQGPSRCRGAQREALSVAAQVLQEIAGETMAQLAAAPKARREQPAAVEEPAEDDLAARLDAIRS